MSTSTRQMLDVFSRGFQALAASVEGLSDEVLNYQRAPGKWSIKEIVIHVADTELGVATRIKQILSEEQPAIQPTDQDLWAKNLAYKEQDMALALEQFRVVRATLLPLLAGLSSTEWERVGIHPSRGPQTVAQLVELYGNHVMRHIEQIEEIKHLLNKSAE